MLPSCSGFLYVGWYARFQSATLMFVVPMAIVPALRYAIRLGSPAACATRVAAVVFGLILVTVASGWVAPALERMKTRRMWDDFAAQTHGRYYMEPIDVVFDRSSTAKNLPGLIRAALSPPAHRFPGYPNYVAPEDRFAQLGYWRDLKFRGLLLTIAAFMSTFALRSEPRTP